MKNMKLVLIMAIAVFALTLGGCGRQSATAGHSDTSVTSTHRTSSKRFEITKVHDYTNADHAHTTIFVYTNKQTHKQYLNFTTTDKWGSAVGTATTARLLMPDKQFNGQRPKFKLVDSQRYSNKGTETVIETLKDTQTGVSYLHTSSNSENDADQISDTVTVIN